MPHDPITWALILYAALALVGITASAQGRLIVFADLADLVATFAIVMAALFAAYLLGTADRLRPELKGPWIAAVALFGMAAIGFRAWRDNRSVPAAMLATLVKLPFAAITPLLVLRVAAPSGNTAAARANSRALALFALMIIAPLLLVLVHNKDGMRRYLGVA